MKAELKMMQSLRALAGRLPWQVSEANRMPSGGSSSCGRVLNLSVLATCLLLLVVLRRAWLCDDAFITIRATQNLLDGQYFAYNGDERVQAFTNPLWALLLSVPIGLFKSVYWGPILLGLLLTLATAIVLCRRVASSATLGAMVLGVFCFCRSFVDFSTSGLENPLSHLLLVLLAAELLRSPCRLWLVSLYGALAYVNRIDTLLLSLPIVLYLLLLRKRLKDICIVSIGAIPAIAWTLFSVIYYGFPFPNTAYAKLNLAIPRFEILMQGLAYALDVLIHDPITALMILLGFILGLAAARISAKSAVIVAAMSMYSAYIVFVGGDFMSGRMWTPVLVLSAVTIAQWGDKWLGSPARRWVAGVVAATLMATSPFSPLRDDDTTESPKVPVTGIANERAWYRETTLAWQNVRTKTWQKKGFYLEGKRAAEMHGRVLVYGYIGQFGLGAGPSVHVIDDLALADPLLARIPFEPESHWRIGHFRRRLPAGYLESVKSGNNLIVDRCLHAYYDELRIITYGSTWSAERWRAIWHLNQPKSYTVRSCSS